MSQLPYSPSLMAPCSLTLVAVQKFDIHLKLISSQANGLAGADTVCACGRVERLYNLILCIFLDVLTLCLYHRQP